MAFEDKVQVGGVKPGGMPAARVFVALKVAPEIANKLVQMAASLPASAVRLVAPADIHLTLIPPWNETAIPVVIEKLRGIAATAAPFTLTFRRLCYGPEVKRPRLLWADCALSDELLALHAALRLAFGQTEDRPFVPHVTVARIRSNGRLLARKHPIDRALTFSQTIETVELMQSPPVGGVGYRVLSSLGLGRASE